MNIFLCFSSKATLLAVVVYSYQHVTLSRGRDIWMGGWGRGERDAPQYFQVCQKAG